MTRHDPPRPGSRRHRPRRPRTRLAAPDWLAAFAGCLPSSVGTGFRHVTDARYVAVWRPADMDEIERVLA